jgi:hypothetical protein
MKRSTASPRWPRRARAGQSGFCSGVAAVLALAFRAGFCLTLMINQSRLPARDEDLAFRVSASPPLNDLDSAAERASRMLSVLDIGFLFDSGAAGVRGGPLAAREGPGAAWNGFPRRVRPHRVSAYCNRNRPIVV